MNRNKITLEPFRVVHRCNKKIPVDLKQVNLPKRTLVVVRSFVRAALDAAPTLGGFAYSGPLKNCPKTFTPNVCGYHSLVLTTVVGGKTMSYKSPLFEVA